MLHSLYKPTDHSYAWQKQLVLTEAEAASAQHLLHATPQATPDAMRDRLIAYAASEPELALLVFAYLISPEGQSDP